MFDVSVFYEHHHGGIVDRHVPIVVYIFPAINLIVLLLIVSFALFSIFVQIANSISRYLADHNHDPKGTLIYSGAVIFCAAKLLPWVPAFLTTLGMIRSE